MSPLIEDLAQDRHAARYRNYEQAQRRRAPAPRGGADLSVLANTRSRAGWLLIGLGLRLVVRGGESPVRGARLLG